MKWKVTNFVSSLAIKINFWSFIRGNIFHCKKLLFTFSHSVNLNWKRMCIFRHWLCLLIKFYAMKNFWLRKHNKKITTFCLSISKLYLVTLNRTKSLFRVQELVFALPENIRKSSVQNLYKLTTRVVFLEIHYIS